MMRHQSPREEEPTLDGAWDCHFHVFDDPDAARARGVELNTTQRGTVQDVLDVFDSQGITRGLAVGAAPYETDNGVLVDSLAMSQGRLKGIAVVDPRLSEAEFAELIQAGVVGTRMNLMTWGMRQLTEPGVDRLFAMMREAGWFLDLHVARDNLLPAVDLLRAAGVRLLFDHFGRPDPQLGIDQPGFAAMLDFGRHTDAAVKLSGPYRCSQAAPQCIDVDPFVEAVIDAFGLERCVWGSDWPFTNAPSQVDYAVQLACLSRWLPDERDRHQVLNVNPSRLFL
jgi:predicted TIM-barrel fold metal-dependent hydrolase